MIERKNTPAERKRGPVWSLTAWMLAIFGAIATFLGFFVMFGNESSSIGLGGEVSWEVGEISNAWMYGLLIAGGVMLLAALYMAIAGRKRPRIEPSPLADLVAHAVIFTVVNSFVWMQDVALGDGLDYALWVTIPWGIGLLTHVGMYVGTPKEQSSGTPPDAIEEEIERTELQHH